MQDAASKQGLELRGHVGSAVAQWLGSHTRAVASQRQSQSQTPDNSERDEATSGYAGIRQVSMCALPLHLSCSLNFGS